MSNTPFELAQARLKAVEEMDKIIAREREQVEELAQLRERHDTLLLHGTSDLYAAVNKYESELIRFALKAADKSVSDAAAMLKVKHQTLAAIIKTRHPELLSERSPVHRRKRA